MAWGSSSHRGGRWQSQDPCVLFLKAFAVSCVESVVDKFVPHVQLVLLPEGDYNFPKDCHSASRPISTLKLVGTEEALVEMSTGGPGSHSRVCLFQ